MQNTYILNLKRSAIAKYGGAFLSTQIVDIASDVLKDAVAPFQNIEIMKRIDEVIMGNVLSAGLGQNPARLVAVKAGLPENTPAFTVNKVCGSGLKSVVLAAQAIAAGDANCLVAGGMESMSRSPYLVDNYRFGVKLNNQTMRDEMVCDGLFCQIIGAHMGVTAENISQKYAISREDQDQFALSSHQKAVRAIEAHIFENEITPITTKDGIVKEDEQPRRDTTLERLGKLKPVFKTDGTVTAGNSSSLNDAAAVAIVASEKFVNQHQLKPMAIIKGYDYVGTDPNYMGLGSYYAAMGALKKAGLTVADIDVWEINEAFASQAIAVIKLLGVNPEVVNVNGGAVALGHPIGASGARILTTLLYELKRKQKKYGLASLCIGGGQGIAMIVENIL